MGSFGSPCRYLKSETTTTRETSEIWGDHIDARIEFREIAAHISKHSQHLVEWLRSSLRGTNSVFCGGVDIRSLVCRDIRGDRPGENNDTALGSIPAEIISRSLNT